jgi:FkbM family methyltransferase
MKHWRELLRQKLENISFKHKLIKRKVIIRKSCYRTYAWHPKKWHMEDSPPISWMLDHVSANDVLLDIGANRGYYALAVLAVQPRAQVVAFEPNPHVFEKLKKNIRLNSWSERIIALNLAVGEKEGSLPLNIARSDSASSFDPKWATMWGRKIVAQEDVIVKPLDAILLEYKIANPNHIKIDTEGFELPILLGAKNVLKNCHPHLYLEAHPRHENDRTIDDLCEFLSNYGYNIKQEGRFLFCI